MAERIIKLSLAYDGTAYAGWQLQPGRPTLQGTIETALAKIHNQPVRVFAAGRTDAGVHALGQVAHFATSARLSGPEFLAALNSLLPADVQVLSAEEAEPTFHAQYQAERKRYHYHLYLGAPAPLFARRYVWAGTRPLAPDRLQASLEVLQGTHDFAAFQSVGSGVEKTIRTMYKAEVQSRGRLVTLAFEADGFLRHMVRALVGTAVRLAEPAEMAAILAGRDRARAGQTAPAQGLFLVWVGYPGPGQIHSAPGPFDPSLTKEWP